MQLIVDAAMDAWFALDMGVQLCTAVVLPSGEITIDKDRIRSTFFRKRFFIHYAPALLLYITDLVGAPIWVSPPPSRAAPACTGA